jgi:hypothetical protein
MVAPQGNNIVHLPMEDAIRLEFVDPQSSLVQMARDLGIVFG